MDALLVILGIVCIIAGIVGSVLPALPGLPLSYCGILLLHFTEKIQFTTQFLVFWALLVIAVSLLDYYIPIWGTKKFGGSKRGVWGCAIGMVVGIFLGPWGIIVGPFAGAVIGELTGGKQSTAALKAGFGSFLGFVAGVAAKLIVGAFLLFYAIKEII